MLTVEVCDQTLFIKLDTGASLSSWRRSCTDRLFPSFPFGPQTSCCAATPDSSPRFRGSTRQRSSGRQGDTPAALSHEGFIADAAWPVLDLGVGCLLAEVPGGSPTHAERRPDVPALRMDVHALFQPRLGTFLGTKSGLYVPEDAGPRFFKPRPLSFSLKGMIQELLLFLRKGITIIFFPLLILLPNNLFHFIFLEGSIKH